MTCPVCGGKTKVVDTRNDCDSIVRRRRCTLCEYLFYTMEVESEEAQDYYRERFNRDRKKFLNSRKDKN